MTVAATKTKAEQALTQSFEAVAPKLPGGRAVAEARKAAIGTFAALGLPHRRIEEWKYTDLRVALKEALPPAVGSAAEDTAQEIDGALATLAALETYRVVFVDGMHAPELSAVAGAKGLEITPLAAALAKSADRAGDGLIREGAPGQEAVIALNTAFMTDGVIKANMTSNDAIETYAPDPSIFESEYFTEKLETKAGWNRPSCDEDWFRGFAQEIEDFVDAIREGREPRSGIDLAVECVNVIYAAYESAETGRRVAV